MLSPLFRQKPTPSQNDTGISEMPLRHLHGLSAAVSGHLRRGFTASATHPSWVMMEHIKLRPSSAQRASLEVAEPPGVSHLVVPDHLTDLDPVSPADPDSDILHFHIANCGATSGDGLLLLDFTDLRATAPVVATHPARPQRKLEGNGVRLYSRSGATQERRVTGYNLTPDVTRFVCNPVTGQMFRLPDIDGTKKTMSMLNVGLLTKSARVDGPPDRYAVAWIDEERDGGEKSFVMRRFLSQTGEWEKLVGLPSPLPPLGRQLGINPKHEVLAFDGRLWWIDLSWGAVSVDPFSDRPELRFVELPKGRMLREPNSAEEMAPYLMTTGMFRRMGVSEGRLRYVEVSQEPPYMLRSFALDGDGCGWALQHQVGICRPGTEHQFQGQTPWIGAIDPLNASVVCVIHGDYVLAVDMDKREVLGCSYLGETEYQQRTIFTTKMLPCQLPPWLGSSRIPSSGKKEGAENKTLADVLVRSGRD